MEFQLTPFVIQEVKDTIEYCIPKGIRILNCEKLWNEGYTGKGIKVAVLDTGCDINHICLKDRIIDYKNFTFNGDKNDVTDIKGHGTHVAGIIAGNRVKEGVTGVAPDCELIICKVISSHGGFDEDIIEGLEYAISKNVDIINMSIGGTGDHITIHKLIKKATELGISVVCAGGNYGDGNAETDELIYPGAYEEVIEVGAVDSNDMICKFSNSNDMIDVCSYGKGITSTFPENRYAKLDGTSQATPHVSGVLALLKQKFKVEQGRVPTEMELYNELIKYTKQLEGVDKRLQGHGVVHIF